MKDYRKTDLWTRVKKYWDAYPKRENGSKGNPYTVYLWWKAERPDDDIEIEIMEWCLAKQENMIYCKKKEIFCEPPKDMERWLQGCGWTIPIGEIEKPEIKRAVDIDEQNQTRYESEKTDTFMEDGMEKTYAKYVDTNDTRWKQLAVKLWPEVVSYARSMA